MYLNFKKTMELVSGIIASTLGAMYSGIVAADVDVGVLVETDVILLLLLLLLLLLFEALDDSVDEADGIEILKLSDNQESVW